MSYRTLRGTSFIRNVPKSPRAGTNPPSTHAAPRTRRAKGLSCWGQSVALLPDDEGPRHSRGGLCECQQRTYLDIASADAQPPAAMTVWVSAPPRNNVVAILCLRRWVDHFSKPTALTILP